MKKVCLLLVLGLAATTVSFAQERITWGLHAGVNISTITDKDPEFGAETSSAKAGFTGGVDVQIPVSSSFAIQPELNFSQLGGKQNIDSDDVSSGKYTENYLTLPVLVKYKVPNTGLSIYVGPQYGYLLSAKGSGQVAGTNVTASASATSYYNRSDFAGIFGAEYYFPCRFGISARYQLGFTNIGNKNNPDAGLVAGETVKNHGFTFTLGYRF